jgi:hypothetical protein
MGIDLVKILALLPARVVRREASKSGLITLDLDKMYQINLDEHDEYTFTHAALCFSKPNHQVFYDGSKKVLEYVYDGQNLDIQIFTAQQTNVFVDIIAAQCNIHAAGPLFIQGDFKIASQYNIQAKALILDGITVCNGTVTLSAEEDLRLFGALNSQNFVMRAGFYNQNATVNVKQFADVTAQVFCHSADSVFNTSTLRMISEIAKIEGSFEVRKASFLAIAQLVLEGDARPAFIQFPAVHHMHLGSFNIQGQVQVIIGTKDVMTAESLVVIDDYLELDALSALTCYQVNMKCGSMVCAGEVQIHDSFVTITTLLQKNNLSLLRSSLEAKAVDMETGRFLVASAYIHAKKISVFAGELLIKDKSTLVVADKLMAARSSIFKLMASNLIVKQKVVLQGISKISSSSIQTNSLITSQALSIKKSAIIVELMQLSDKVAVHEVVCQARNASFLGQLQLYDLRIEATNIEYQSADANIEQSYAKAKHILLQGSNKTAGFLFKNTRLVAKNFTTRANVCAKESSFVGIDDAGICHDIKGQFTLEKSKFITHIRLHSLLGSHLNLCEFSKIVTGEVSVQGKLNIDQSTALCHGLSINGAAATVRLGDIDVAGVVSIHDAKIALDAGSKIVAGSMIASNHSNISLKKSKMFLRNQFLTSKDSTVTSQGSDFVGGKMKFLGEAELTQSLLNAEELIIYESFTAQASVVHSAHDIVFAHTAKTKISTSTLSAKNISSFGGLVLADSQLQAQADIALWTGSSTTLSGASVIKGEDVIIRGGLATQKKQVAEEQETSQQSAYKPVIVASKSINISAKAKISGNDNLTLVADSVNQSGQIDLQAKLTATGVTLKNYGHMTADAMQLGFDDAVINYGAISAKNLTIHSNVMNICGQIYAQESLACAGFASLNLGVIAANNYTNDSLLSLNAGLITPNLYADPRFILSWNNLISSARTLALMWAPAHSSGIQLAFMAPGILISSTSLYQHSKGLTRIFDLKRHEYMPMLCQMKSVLLLGHSVYTGGAKLYNSEYADWQTSFKSMYNNPDLYGQAWNKTLANTNWQEFGLNAGTAFLGSYTDTSLVHANLGLSFAPNTIKSNLIHVNMGQEHSLLSHNISTNIMLNSGKSTGSKASFTATYIKNKGILSGSQQFYMHAKTAENTQGSIKGAHATIEIESMAQQGEFSVTDGHVHIGSLQDSLAAKTTFTDCLVEGALLRASGALSLNNSQAQIDKVNFSESARPVLKDSTIVTQDCIDDSQLSYQGAASIVTDSYKHTGYIRHAEIDSDKPNTFYVKAKTGELAGGGDLDNVIYEIDSLANAAELIAGSGDASSYKISEALTVAVKQGVALTGDCSRSCDITLEATKIDSDMSYENTKAKLTLLTTVGDINNSGKLHTGNLYLNSAASIYNDGSLLSAEKAILDSKQDISNAGLIGAGTYTQCVAGGKVINVCNASYSKEGGHQRASFKAGTFLGGSGADNPDGIGLYVYAGDKIDFAAGNVISGGTNYILGVHGVNLDAQQHEYGFKTYGSKGREYCNRANDYLITQIESLYGQNIIISTEGDVTTKGTNFKAWQNATDIYAKKDIKLNALRLNEDWAETTPEKKHINHQAHTAILTNLNTETAAHVHAEEGMIDARGARFFGYGSLDLHAKGKVLLSRDIVDHSYSKSGTKLNIKLPGQSIYDDYQATRNILDTILNQDSAYLKAQALSKSAGGLSQAAAALNLGIEATNTANSFSRGLAHDDLVGELLARYGINSNVSVSASSYTSSGSYQTMGQGGIHCAGKVSLSSDEDGVYLFNGVDVLSKTGVEVNARFLAASAAELHAQTKQKQIDLNLSFGAEGLKALGLSYNSKRSDITTYHYASISAPQVSLHWQGGAMDKVTLDGANINCKVLDAKIKHLSIIDKQDLVVTTTQGCSLSSSGQFSVASKQRRDIYTAQHSGIDVTEGLNTGGHSVEIGELDIIGSGGVDTDGENKLKPGVVKQTELKDSSYSSGFGIAGNIHDLERLTGLKSHNTRGEKSLATMHISVAHQGRDIDIDVPITNGSYTKALSNNVEQLSDKVEQALAPKSDPKIPKHSNLLFFPIPLSRRRKSTEKLSQSDSPKPHNSLAKASESPGAGVIAIAKQKEDLANLYISREEWTEILNTFIANNKSAATEADQAKLKRAVLTAVIEKGIEAGIEASLGSAAGPINGMLSIISIADSLYDEDHVKALQEQGLTHLYNSQQQQSFFSAERFLASEQIAAASRAEAGHFIASIPDRLAGILLDDIEEKRARSAQEEREFCGANC